MMANAKSAESTESIYKEYCCVICDTLAYDPLICSLCEMAVICKLCKED